jgi:hypothetical protein
MSMSFMNYHTALGLGHIGDSTENQHAAAGVWLGDREERKKAFVHVRTVRIASRYLHFRRSETLFPPLPMFHGVGTA